MTDRNVYRKAKDLVNDILLKGLDFYSSYS